MKRKVEEESVAAGPEEEAEAEAGWASSTSPPSHKRSKPYFPTISPPKGSSDVEEDCPSSDSESDPSDTEDVSDVPPASLPTCAAQSPTYHMTCTSALIHVLDHHLLHFYEHAQEQLQDIESHIHLLSLQLKTASWTLSRLPDDFLDHLFSPSEKDLESYLHQASLEHKVLYDLPLGYQIEKFIWIAKLQKQEYKTLANISNTVITSNITSTMKVVEREVHLFNFLNRLLQLILYVHLRQMYDMFYQQLWKQIITKLQSQRSRNTYKSTNIMMYQLATLSSLERLLSDFQSVLDDVKRFTEMLELTRRKHLDLPILPSPLLSSSSLPVPQSSSSVQSGNSMNSKSGGREDISALKRTLSDSFSGIVWEDELPHAAWMESRRQQQVHTSETLFISLIHDIPSVLVDINNNMYCAFERISKILSPLPISMQHTHNHNNTFVHSMSSFRSPLQLNRILNPINISPQFYLVQIRDMFTWNHQSVLEMKLVLHRGMNVAYLPTYSDYYHALHESTKQHRLHACQAYRQAIHHIEQSEVYFCPHIQIRYIYQHLHQLYVLHAKNTIPLCEEPFLCDAIEYAETALKIRKSLVLMESTHQISKQSKNLIVHRRKFASFLMQVSKCCCIVQNVVTEMQREFNEYHNLSHDAFLTGTLFTVEADARKRLYCFFNGDGEFSNYMKPFLKFMKQCVRAFANGIDILISGSSSNVNCNSNEIDVFLNLSLQFMNAMKLFCEILFLPHTTNEDHEFITKDIFCMLVTYGQNLVYFKAQDLYQNELFHELYGKIANNGKNKNLVRKFPILRSSEQDVVILGLKQTSKRKHYILHTKSPVSSSSCESKNHRNEEWLVTATNILQLICDKYLVTAKLRRQYNSKALYHLCQQFVQCHHTCWENEEPRVIQIASILIPFYERLLSSLDLGIYFQFNKEAFGKFDDSALEYLQAAEELAASYITGEIDTVGLESNLLQNLQSFEHFVEEMKTTLAEGCSTTNGPVEGQMQDEEQVEG